MSLTLTGQKKGMIQVFDEEGRVVVCTVLQVDPNPVLQLIRSESGDLRSVQMAAIPLTKSRAKNVTKPLKGHFAKAKVEPHRVIREARVDKEEISFEVGQSVDLSVFQGVEFVDVQAVSKGKGYQGVMKLHGFAGGPAAHGSGFHRHAGSTGQRSTPGRCLPGGKRASRMGGDLKTVENLKVVSLQGNLLLVKGAVPGSCDAVVAIRRAQKKNTTAKK